MANWKRYNAELKMRYELSIRQDRDLCWHCTDNSKHDHHQK